MGESASRVDVVSLSFAPRKVCIFKFIPFAERKTFQPLVMLTAARMGRLQEGTARECGMKPGRDLILREGYETGMWGYGTGTGMRE